MELNSLEDAYVKIAEDEIAAKEATKEDQNFIGNEEEDYRAYSEAIGQQTFWGKATTVMLIRLRSFLR